MLASALGAIALVMIGVGALYQYSGTLDHTGPSRVQNRQLETIVMQAEQGNAAAQYQLGLRYQSGDGVPPLASEAIEWLNRAAQQGHAGAQLDLGLAYLDYGNETDQPDLKQASHWLTRAAEQGEAEAQYLLGTLYSKGHGVIQDYMQAAQWFEKAADAGHADAMYHLGMMYATGEGVAKDRVQAYVWFNLAAAAGDHSAVIAREEVAGLLSPEQLAQGQARSRDLDKQQAVVSPSR